MPWMPWRGYTMDTVETDMLQYFNVWEVKKGCSPRTFRSIDGYTVGCIKASFF